MNKKVEIGVAVGVLVLLIILTIILLRPKSTPTLKPVQEQIPNAQTTPGETTTGTTPVSALPPEPASPTTTASIFIARFTSYSSESDYTNVDDVLPLATAAFKVRLQEIAQDQRSRDVATEYYGLSTKVIGSTKIEETSTGAKVKLMTQQQESVGGPGNTYISYKNVTVDLVKEGDTWKVNGFAWEG